MTHAISRKTSKTIVKEQRWVHRNELRTGMYVVELEKPWEQTPFMFQGFYLDSAELLEAVQAESEYVLVQMEKFADISVKSPFRLCGNIWQHRKRRLSAAKRSAA